MSDKIINLLFIYLPTLLLIINSGSSIGIIFGSITIPIYLWVTIIITLVNKRPINIKNLLILLFITLYCIINYFIHINDNPYIKSYIVLLMNLIATMLFISSIKYSAFKKAFINIMFIVSLYCMIIFIVGLNFNLNQYAYNVGKHYLFMGFNLFAIWIGRNSGIFWEPGGYQIFLNMALFFLMDGKELNFSTIDWIKSAIIILSIITTKSATGYIVLAMIVFYFFSKKVNIKNIFTSTFIIPVGIAILLLIFNSQAIQMKLSKTNPSFLERKHHFIYSLKAIKQSPWTGFGYLSKTRIKLSETYGLKDNSVGIFSVALNFGIPYTVIYLTRIIHIYGRQHYFNKFIFIAFMSAICVSQAIFDYPILLMFLFNFWNPSQEVTNLEQQQSNERQLK